MSKTSSAGTGSDYGFTWGEGTDEEYDMWYGFAPAEDENYGDVLQPKWVEVSTD